MLAVIGSNLPSPLRIFRLTLAVVDDLIAIVIIAFAFTDELRPPYLLMAIMPIALYTVLTHKFPKFFASKRWTSWLILLPLGIFIWALIFGSGIHATIAGVMLSFCVPVFAFFAAGVAISGASGIASAFRGPVLWGIVLGMILGKPIRLMTSTWLVTRGAKANLYLDVPTSTWM